MRTTDTSGMTPYFNELSREWAAFIEQGTVADRVDDWIERWPVLAPVTDPDTSTWGVRLSRTEADEILRELLIEHAEGDYPAGRLVLQCMLPAVVRVATRSQHRYQNLSEAAAMAVSAMWIAIAEFDAGQSRENIATKLWSRTLEQVAGTRARQMATTLRTTAVKDEHLEFLADARGSYTLEDTSLIPYPSLTTTNLGPTGEVLQVIAWGVDVGAISGKEASVLTRLYAPDPDFPEYEDLEEGGSFQRRVAEELGISFDTMRQQASRAVRRLAKAVQEGL